MAEQIRDYILLSECASLRTGTVLHWQQCYSKFLTMVISSPLETVEG